MQDRIAQCGHCGRARSGPRVCTALRAVELRPRAQEEKTKRSPDNTQGPGGEDTVTALKWML